MVTPEALAPVPESIGRFSIRGRVGSGASGDVLIGVDPKLGRRVAIKLLRPLSGGHDADERRARLRKEARALAQLSHPNVVTVYELGTHAEQEFMVSELIEGGTLRDWISDAERNTDEVLAVFAQAGRGLAAAHAAGLVHRDFKPDNVLVGKDGRARIADFGLVSLADAAGDIPDDTEVDQLALTQTGMLVGTPVYMAPEQTLGSAPDALSDQFAFCVALHECLAGVRPFAGRKYAELIRNVRAGRVRPASDGRRIPPRVRRVVLRGLRPNPKDRYPTMDALLRALGRPTRTWQGIVAALVAIAVVSVVAWRLRGDRQPVVASQPSETSEAATPAASAALPAAATPNEASTTTTTATVQARKPSAAPEQNKPTSSRRRKLDLTEPLTDRDGDARSRKLDLKD